MKQTIAMDKAGRVVLPKSLREQLNLVPGDTFCWSVDGGGIRLEPACEKGNFARRGTVLVLTSEFAEPITTTSVAKLLARERERRLTAGEKPR